MATLPEPWRVRVVEPIRLVSPERRKEALAAAGYNVFRIPAADVFIDLLTDSGTGAMSASQWAGLQIGDESYAGAKSWFHLEGVVKELTGHAHVFPVHQGRGAEAIYCKAFVEPGDAVLGNLHFDTTRAHIMNRGGRPVDCVIDAGLVADDKSPFKGNVDLDKAERAVRAGGVKLFILTVTANTNGGQPVSLENARAVRAFCTKHGIKLVIDAARFPENAYFIKQREPGQGARSVQEIASELLGLADLVAMSAKKAALVNIGGFLSVRAEDDYQRCLPSTILHEGYLTYGGMAGRDLEALARGLIEGLDEGFLAARIGQVARLHSRLAAHGVPLLHPSGGHSVVIDAGKFLDHLSREEFAAEALTSAIYLRGGVRAVGHGALAFGELDEATGKLKPPKYENVRMAIPRRVYSDNHLDYVADIVAEVYDDRRKVRGLKAVYLPAQLAIFTASLTPA
ncbi:MAG: tryptophanase [Kofleriaceae bacterium]